MGRTVSPRTFGHNGAGGQIAWADPATGLSFCYFTNGHRPAPDPAVAPHDRDREPRRGLRRVQRLAGTAALPVGHSEGLAQGEPVKLDVRKVGADGRRRAVGAPHLGSSPMRCAPPTTRRSRRVRASSSSHRGAHALFFGGLAVAVVGVLAVLFSHALYESGTKFTVGRRLAAGPAPPIAAVVLVAGGAALEQFDVRRPVGADPHAGPTRSGGGDDHATPTAASGHVTRRDRMQARR